MPAEMGFRDAPLTTDRAGGVTSAERALPVPSLPGELVRLLDHLIGRASSTLLWEALTRQRSTTGVEPVTLCGVCHPKVDAAVSRHVRYGR
jgi:hypothetical protein